EVAGASPPSACSRPRASVVATPGGLPPTPPSSVDLQDRQEGLLRDLHATDLLHALLPLFLFFEELARARDVAAVAFGRHVLAERAHRLPRDDLAPNGRLDGDLVLLLRDELLELLRQGPPSRVGPLLVRDDGESVQRLSIHHHVHLDQVVLAKPDQLV